MRTGVKLVLFIIMLCLASFLLFKANARYTEYVNKAKAVQKEKVKVAFDRGINVGRCDVAMQMYGVPKKYAMEYCLCAEEADYKKDENGMKLCMEIMRSKLKQLIRKKNGR